MSVVAKDAKTQVSLRYYPSTRTFVLRDDVTGTPLEKFKDFTKAAVEYDRVVREVTADLAAQGFAAPPIDVPRDEGYKTEMPKTNSTLIVAVLDRSGSMGSIRGDTIGGFNTFVKDQQANKVDVCTLSLVQFDDIYEVHYANRPIEKVEPLTEATFVPRGMTALFDAIGKAINDTGAALAALPEDKRPSAVVVVIMTDGGENASREFAGEAGRVRVFEMIKHQTDVYKWQFLFLGANQDAIKTGAGLGIPTGNAVSYQAGAAGTQAVIGSVSRNLSSYRSTKSASDLIFTNDQRTAAAGDDEDLKMKVIVSTTGNTPNN